MHAIFKSAAVTMLVVVLGGEIARADHIVIDFQSLERNNAGDNYAGSLYQEDGFTVQNMTGTDVFAFSRWGTQSQYYVGSTALVNRYGEGVTRLTKSGNGTFDLLSIDIAHWSVPNLLGVQAVFIGTHLNGSTVTQTFNLPGQSTLQFWTVALNGFSDLVKFEINQPYHTFQFDNITIESDGLIAVPVPSGMILMGLGAVLVSIRVTHRKRVGLLRPKTQISM